MCNISRNGKSFFIVQCVSDLLDFCFPPLHMQVVLFTLTIPHQRSEFFYESREVFKKLFILERFGSFQTSYSLYTIEDMLTQIEFTATRVGSFSHVTGCPGNNIAQSRLRISDNTANMHVVRYINIRT